MPTYGWRLLQVIHPNLVMTAKLRHRISSRITRTPMALSLPGNPERHYHAGHPASIAVPTNWGNSNSSIVDYYADNIGENVFNNWMWNKGTHVQPGASSITTGSTTQTTTAAATSPSARLKHRFPTRRTPTSRSTASSFAASCWALPDAATRTSIAVTAAHTNSISGYARTTSGSPTN